MRNVIYGINLTTDGCCDHTKFNGSEEIQDYFRDHFSRWSLICNSFFQLHPQPQKFRKLT